MFLGHLVFKRLQKPFENGLSRLLGIVSNSAGLFQCVQCLLMHVGQSQLAAGGVDVGSFSFADCRRDARLFKDMHKFPSRFLRRSMNGEQTDGVHRNQID